MLLERGEAIGQAGFGGPPCGEVPALAGERWVSSSEAARLLGVSVTTLKRWADDELIGSGRTNGGHRRFRRADVERFGARCSPERQAPPRLEALLAAEGTLALQQELLAERARSASWWDVWLGLQPTLERLGERWREGAWTRVQLLAAFDRLGRAAGGLAELIAPAPGARGLLLSSAPGAVGLAPLRFLELCAREAGWRVRFAGCASLADLAAELDREPASAIASVPGAGCAPDEADAFTAGLAALGEARGVPAAVLGLGAWPEDLDLADRRSACARARDWLTGAGDTRRPA
ncbi:MerR family transcriptional regulator [Anaeromyxobacter paludicola]|uniref:HTH merR-type domain-containing protein n=1 Tax=Anaeromyxobacter paludicola TaxID=2918171 RepID=A0ABN6N9V9_9BACT|nr:helix-turn-helix domain-containing protein [Anaeromyxobacter paludicola]BDG10014.1 hypothetical protein AMPC_31270 [Anaeromyxobacter paludicola]